MNCYRIKNWNEKYECNRTRDHKELQWFSCPIKLDGDGYTLIAELPDGSKRQEGAAIFGAWMACVQVAARCHPRGTFVQSNGRPHDAASLARKTRLPMDIISMMLEFCYQQCKWLEIIQIKEPAGIPQEDAPKPHEGATIPQDGAEKPRYITLHNTTVINKTPGAPPPVNKKLKRKPKSEGIDLGNGRIVSWSFFQKLVGIMGDRYQATLIIYRAKDKEDPAGWIIGGLQKPKIYALLPCPDEEINSPKVQQWIDEKINKYEPTPAKTALLIFRKKTEEIEKTT